MKSNLSGRCVRFLSSCFVVGAVSASCNSPDKAGPGAEVTRAAPPAPTQTPASSPSRVDQMVPQASSSKPQDRVLAGTITMFDGRTLGGWQVADQADFEHHGSVYLKDNAVFLDAGSPATGIRWAAPFPRNDYEVTLDAMRVEGSDFFCGMTFPVGESPCTLIVGGWGGSVVGLSNVDGRHAEENETTSGMTFENERWYRIRLRVTRDSIEAWIDDQQKVDLAREDHRFTIWMEQEPMKPFGIATWYTKAALRNIVVRAVK